MSDLSRRFVGALTRHVPRRYSAVGGYSTVGGTVGVVPVPASGLLDGVPSTVCVPKIELTRACTIPNGLAMPGVPPRPSGITRLRLKLAPKRRDGEHPPESSEQAPRQISVKVAIRFARRILASILQPNTR